MFYRVRDASKVALVALVAHLGSRGYDLFDIQQATPHALSMGAQVIPRHAFVERLEAALRRPVTFGAQLELTRLPALIERSLRGGT